MLTHELRFCDKLPAMAVKTEKELSASLHALWLKAVAAIELRNFGYAISLLQEILTQEPEFLTGRELLRRTEVTKSKSAKKSFFNISITPMAVTKAQREIKKDPKRAVEILEKVLEKKPYNRQAPKEDVDKLKLLKGHVQKGQFVTKLRKIFTKAEMDRDLEFVRARVNGENDDMEYVSILPTSPP